MGAEVVSPKDTFTAWRISTPSSSSSISMLDRNGVSKLSFPLRIRLHPRRLQNQPLQDMPQLFDAAM
ncbi:hypothetical protein NSQ80_03780 [Paenibacillus sp. FSL K6-2441]|uniref:hypothetical protein n=1 Tax=Paenibacillus sp. FSL K6-2441 TaxID=2954679 RepID=UPI0012F7661F